MSSIIFDEELRSFSVVDDQREFGVMGSIGGHLTHNSRKYIVGGSTAVGSGAGMIIARKKIKAKLAAQGINPGTPEYKKAMKSAMIKGGLIGGGIGAAGGYVGATGGKIAINYFKEKDHRSLGSAAKKEFGAQGTSFKKSWNTVTSKFHKKNK